ncbi:hypothetical protein K440DRAFT_257314 [Wilcoxina mikolae CBS 423.85]|nr:hypothetical protein K440DRAFT_257314 [Wilcoxina mikolae CBS 423.85]
MFIFLVCIYDTYQRQPPRRETTSILESILCYVTGARLRAIYFSQTCEVYPVDAGTTRDGDPCRGCYIPSHFLRYEYLQDFFDMRNMQNPVWISRIFFFFVPVALLIQRVVPLTPPPGLALWAKAPSSKCDVIQAITSATVSCMRAAALHANQAKQLGRKQLKHTQGF